MTLPKPECEFGYTKRQIRKIMGPGPREAEFWAWMGGQTMSYCSGEQWNHTHERYELCCGGVAHGTIVYPWDVERFLAGLPVID